MKTIKRFLTVSAAIAATLSLQAQSNAQLDGLIVTAGQFTPVDMMQYSRNDYSFTTARVAAMGGAFTALGGDMSSIGINPAGLGMYRSSVWGFTPAVTFTQNENSFAYSDNNASRFGFNNIGTVLHLTESSRGLISFNLGISYNKIDDFNFRGGVQLPAAAGGSMLNIFQLQLNGLGNGWVGIPERALNDDPYNNGDIYVDEWGAVLGYQSGIFSSEGRDLYALNGIPENSNMTPSLRYDSRGSVGEYNIAGGFNIDNFLYLGFDFGFQDIYRNLSLYYTEDYEGNYAGTAQKYLRQMRYNQYTTARGSAFDFKIGAIIRPIPALRIGISYHSPSYTSLRKEYYASMGTARYGDTKETHATTLVTGYDYSYNTPSRLLTGIAFTLGDFAAISFDYERVWYNKMRYLSETYQKQEDFRTSIEREYKPADNFRVGLEVKPVPWLALRAGYAYYASPVKEKDDAGNTLIFKSIFTTSSNHISAGVGFRLGRAATLDVAYVYSRYRVAPYGLYYYNGPAVLPEGEINEVTYKPMSDITGGTMKRHTVSMSFNFLF